MKEVWKQISGWGHYQVSNLGNVRSSKGRLLKPLGKPNGHKYVVLSNAPRKRYAIISRLVLAAFKGDKPELQADHKNRIRDDNRLSNLRWLTPSQNVINSARIDNSSSKGVVGVSLCVSPLRPDRLGMWRASAWCNKKSYNLGYFNSIEEAKKAVDKFKRKYKVTK